MKTPSELTAHKRSFDNGVQIAWDATSLDSAQRCMRYYYYALIRGITPKQKSVHLVFGGIYASCLETFYKLRASDVSFDDAQRQAVRKALLDSWDYENNIPIVFDDASKTRINLIRTIIWYLEEFGDETDSGIKTYHLENGQPAVELSFAVELSEDILYCGHLDRVVDQGGSLFVFDQKTTGSTLSSYFFSSFKPSNQMSGYAYAGQIILKSPISGVIIDAAQIMAMAVRFERGVTTRSKDEIEEWRTGTIESIKIAQSLTEKNIFPMNPNSCGNYGGCPYRGICSASPKVRENFIKSDFIEHNWDPVKAR